jgi:hypothetical protein
MSRVEVVVSLVFEVGGRNHLVRERAKYVDPLLSSGSIHSRNLMLTAVSANAGRAA